MRRLRRATALPCALLAWALVGCAPTSVAPSIIRLPPTHLGESEFQFGVRTGPRIASVNQARSSGGFDGHSESDVISATGVGYELDYTRLVWRRLALHAGVQAECLGGLPMLGLGLSVGVSYRWQLGWLSIAPAAAARGSTDFGITTIGGGPASHVSGDAALTLSVGADDFSRLGLVPFFGVQQTFQAQDTTSFLFGGLLVVRFRSLELFGGLGRSFIPGGPSWNVPLLGVRVSNL